MKYYLANKISNNCCLLFLFTLEILFPFGFICCTNNNAEKASSIDIVNDIISDEKTDNVFDILLPIKINNKHRDVNYSYDYCYDDEMSFRKTEETDHLITIGATSRYYDQYISGKRFFAPALQVFPENYRENLNIEVDVVNNTNNKLDVEELDFVVEKSNVDSIPFIFIFTCDYASNTIFFSDESYYDWGGVTFYYSILRKGEKFNGKYKSKRYIDYFEDILGVELLDELIDMGYDFEKIKNNIDQVYGVDEEDEGIAVCLYAYEKEDSIKYAHLFSPFEFRRRCENDSYRGFARLYGKLVFDNYDKEIMFYTDMILSAPCGGADSYDDDHFDVKLKTKGEDYTLRYPYSTVIEPYGTEMVSLTIKADKSSNHKFHINLKNKNGLNIRSKDINLHFLAPKHYYISNPKL